MFEPVRINSVHGCADLEGSLGYMCFCDPNMDHLHLGLSVGWLVSLSKDLLKKLTFIDKILSFSTNPFLKFSNIFINFQRPTDDVLVIRSQITKNQSTKK